jgi:hypothetical protein
MDSDFIPPFKLHLYHILFYASVNINFKICLDKSKLPIILEGEKRNIIGKYKALLRK